MKKLIPFFVVIGVLIFFGIKTKANKELYEHRVKADLLKEVKELRIENKQLTKDCNYLAELVKQRDTLIGNFQNHVIRMQLIAGVDNPDNVFTYTEKILNRVDTKKVLNKDRK